MKGTGPNMDPIFLRSRGTKPRPRVKPLRVSYPDVTLTQLSLFVRENRIYLDENHRRLLEAFEHQDLRLWPEKRAQIKRALWNYLLNGEYIVPIIPGSKKARRKSR